MSGPRRVLHAVLPNDIDDPRTPSGGNVYDRRICRGLIALGWVVREHAVRGGWPRPTGDERRELAHVLAGMRDDAVVLVDGLIASAVPEILAPHARRLRLVVLVHMPVAHQLVGRGDAQEGEALRQASAIVTTSDWTAQRLVQWYGLRPEHVLVAVPGVDAAALAPSSRDGSRLLCVAAVTPTKGQDILVAALATVAELDWRCRLVGSLDREPAFVDHLRGQVAAAGLAGRIDFAGPRTGPELDASYAAADLLVLPSRSETYGMVVTEALARGTPVLATTAGGMPQALGRAPDGGLPGLLVPPGEPAELAGALRSWLHEPELRARLSRSAQGRRRTLTTWATTCERISNLLSSLSMSVGTVR